MTVVGFTRGLLRLLVTAIFVDNGIVFSGMSNTWKIRKKILEGGHTNRNVHYGASSLLQQKSHFYAYTKKIILSWGDNWAFLLFYYILLFSIL